VLPLLQAEVVAPRWVTNEAFLAGYGVAQAIPGPLFAFAAYLGAVMEPAPNGVAGAAIALVAIFLPGLLFVYGMLPFWDALRSRPAPKPPCAARTRRWSAFSRWHSTIRSGRTAAELLRISRSRSEGSCC
jgi:hypothetical protein